MDYSLRFKAEAGVLAKLEEKAMSSMEAPPITDHFYKPLGADLTGKFDPNEIVIRLRIIKEEFENAKLTRISIENGPTGYSDSKEILGIGSAKFLAKLTTDLGFEEWGEVKYESKRFEIVKEDYSYTAIYQTLSDIGDFLKIETLSERDMKLVAGDLDLNLEHAINKNSAVLLYERISLKNQP